METNYGEVGCAMKLLVKLLIAKRDRAGGAAKKSIRKKIELEKIVAAKNSSRTPNDRDNSSKTQSISNASAQYRQMTVEYPPRWYC